MAGVERGATGRPRGDAPPAQPVRGLLGRRLRAARSRRPARAQGPLLPANIGAGDELVIGRETLYGTTGIQFIAINTLYQVLADQALEPDLFAQTANRLMIADYFNYRFSGRAVGEVSLASTTQLLDARRGAWATSLMQRFGIPPQSWPEIAPSGTRLGPIQSKITSSVAGACPGLRSGGSCQDRV